MNVERAQMVYKQWADPAQNLNGTKVYSVVIFLVIMDLVVCFIVQPSGNVASIYPNLNVIIFNH